MSTAINETDAGVTLHQTAQVIEKARWAAASFATYPRPTVLAIVEAMAKAGAAEARRYAEWAVEESGFGNQDHKEIKNRLCSTGLYDHYKDENFTDFRVDATAKTVAIPKPAGVIFALTPSTNPVCSVFYKAILALLTRNAIVISPHPAARASGADAARLLARTAEAAGAPDGIIQVIADPTLPIINSIMTSDRINLILATGGSPVVRAAYSSGNPAIGVGPGNNPAYVDETADVARAARLIADSKAFDNSILCTNESAVIAHKAIAPRLADEMKRLGCQLISADDRDRLAEHLFPGGKFNISLLGKSAEAIAESAGLRVPRDTRVLLVPLERIGDDYPLSREKLCPVLGFYEAPDREAALTACRAMIRNRGAGHSAAIHADDPATILRFAAEMDVMRVVINVGCSTGAAGFDTFLGPTMTVGTGFHGRSSIGENIGPQHLVQWTRIAYNSADDIPFADFNGLSLPQPATRTRLPVGDIDYSFDWVGGQPSEPSNVSPNDLFEPVDIADLKAEIRQLIVEELRTMQFERQ
ncbi:MAG: aldehyde dehydrogenase family protein [Hyphomicrobiales bacterium]|nr:aldehyde dehydrogenase family protein [Hyphomicrobiales bacterium]